MSGSDRAGRIQRLSDIIANQIAAGEVIERPASVVKELIENSLDADAKRIVVDIEAGGLRFIRVRDDGEGIHPEDLPLAVAQHATSKILEARDLARIVTLGFRGEALASIAAVSRLRLCSRWRGADVARELTIEPGAAAIETRPAAHPPGTTVEVRDLFHNVPARRKFLRSEPTESLHVQETVRSLALARHPVAFALRMDGRSVLSVPASADWRARIAAVLGDTLMAHAAMLDRSAADVRLFGCVGAPQAARGRTDRQYFFLNGRLLRDRQIQHALRMAYQERVYPGRYPAWVLYLEMDPQRFDINVHPTKHEARFRDARLVHDFIFSAARAALESGIVIPIAAADVMRSTPPADVAAGPVGVAEPPAPEDRDRPTGPGRVLGRIQGRFVLAENNRALIIIDLQRAVELVTLARLRKAAGAGRLRARPLLLPVTLAIDATEVERFERSAADLADLGIVLEWVAPERLSLRGLPALLPAVDPGVLLRELLAVCPGPPSGTERVNMRERWFAIMAGNAGRAAAADGGRLELDELWRELATLDIADEARPWRKLGATDLARLVDHGC